MYNIMHRPGLRGDRGGYSPRASIIGIYLGASDLSITFFVIGYYTLNKSPKKIDDKSADITFNYLYQINQ